MCPTSRKDCLVVCAERMPRLEIEDVENVVDYISKKKRLQKTEHVVEIDYLAWDCSQNQFPKNYTFQICLFTKEVRIPSPGYWFCDSYLDCVPHRSFMIPLLGDTDVEGLEWFSCEQESWWQQGSPEIGQSYEFHSIYELWWFVG